MLSRNSSLILLACVLFTSSAHAQLDDKKRELEATKKQLAATQARHEKLAKNLSEMEHDIASLTEEVTSVAAQIQDYERDLTEIEEKLSLLEHEHGERKKALDARRQQLAATLSTLVRMGQVPQQAVLLMPANFIDKVRASRTLSLTTRGLHGEMEDIRRQLAELQRLEGKITRRRSEVERKTAALHQRQEELRTTAVTRKEMMRSLYSENEEQQKAIASLIGRSEDLQSLVTTLEKARADQIEAQFARIGVPVLKPVPPSVGGRSVPVAHGGEEVRTAPASSAELPSFTAARGGMRMPAGGAIIGSFGQRRGINDTLKGLEIATRDHAQVIAPFDGEVLFTGPFRDYGNMVILRHSDNYHTLLAGFADLDCVPGQQVRKGEPLGIMGSTIEGRRLYLELRHGGKPTDPKPWIAGYQTYLARK